MNARRQILSASSSSSSLSAASAIPEDADEAAANVSPSSDLLERKEGGAGSYGGGSVNCGGLVRAQSDMVAALAATRKGAPSPNRPGGGTLRTQLVGGGLPLVC